MLLFQNISFTPSKTFPMFRSVKEYIVPLFAKDVMKHENKP